MGFFRAIGNAFSSAADAVADAVDAFMEAVSDAGETVGNAIADGLNAIGNAARNIPVIGPALARVLVWLGGVISAAFDYFAAVDKGLGSILGGVASGLIRIVGGILSLDGQLILEGLGDIGSGIAGGVILIGGTFIARVQTVVLLQGAGRRLTAAERQLLRRVFQRSLALYNVRIVEGFAGIFSVNDRPFTLGNTIYVKNVEIGGVPALLIDVPDLLIHECVHVWQHQHGGARYLADALYAQTTLPNEYSWTAELARGIADWVDFNKEAQAQMIENIYTYGSLIVGTDPPVVGNGVFFDADGDTQIAHLDFSGVDHTDLAIAAVAALRGATNFRLSNLGGS